MQRHKELPQHEILF